eukprot:TRINITY_DN522_c0_g1_i4.p1 TRINITY_DN522_c0_g1~~TRINITY_DN522_c0_g1_i4.p1  ORF type:complete len:284 (-),score=79.59 TRINITY_DN522_c0_g1_i4:190-1041(-)
MFLLVSPCVSSVRLLLSLVFVLLSLSYVADANYVWKDTDWVYLEKGDSQGKVPDRPEGSGDKYDAVGVGGGSPGPEGQSSYGSVRTYSSDDEDEGSGYGGEGNPYGDQEDEYEEENEDIHGGERSYYESSGSSDDESREEEEDSPHRTNVYEPIEPRNNLNNFNENHPPPAYTTEDSFFEDNRDDISFDNPYSTQSTPKQEGDLPSVTGKKKKNKSASFFAQPGIMAAVVGGAVVGLLCAILFVMFIVYRMRKKDEGSYALDEPKRSPTVNSYSKPLSREIYA